MNMKIMLLLALLILPALTWAAPDEETLRLERAALCQAMPYRCPGGPPTTATATDPRVVKARQEDERCAELAKHKAVVRRQRKEWKTPIDAADEAALRVWDTTCRDWQKRHHREEMDAADIEYNMERAGIRYRSTSDCLSTWQHGPYSSRLTTTCTGY
jgi:hypothetical protein